LGIVDREIDRAHQLHALVAHTDISRREFRLLRNLRDGGLEVL
jgi:hypothetical protein